MNLHKLIKNDYNLNHIHIDLKTNKIKLITDQYIKKDYIDSFFQEDKFLYLKLKDNFLQDCYNQLYLSVINNSLGFNLIKDVIDIKYFSNSKRVIYYYQALQKVLKQSGIVVRNNKQVTALNKIHILNKINYLLHEENDKVLLDNIVLVNKNKLEDNIIYEHLNRFDNKYIKYVTYIDKQMNYQLFNKLNPILKFNYTLIETEPILIFNDNHIYPQYEIDNNFTIYQHDLNRQYKYYSFIKQVIDFKLKQTQDTDNELNIYEKVLMNYLLNYEFILERVCNTLQLKILANYLLDIYNQYNDHITNKKVKVILQYVINQILNFFNL